MLTITNSMPYAVAEVKGGAAYPEIKGTVSFHEMYGGTLVEVKVQNLPNGFHGFHIHNGSSCMPMMEGGHYNPTNQPHPKHAGDMPPLITGKGMTFSMFYTDRFYPEDVVGKVVVIHEMPDDFTSQPSGNPGVIVACGKIVEESK